MDELCDTLEKVLKRDFGSREMNVVKTCSSLYHFLNIKCIKHFVWYLFVWFVNVG